MSSVCDAVSLHMICYDVGVISLSCNVSMYFAVMCASSECGVVFICTIVYVSSECDAVSLCMICYDACVISL